MRFSKLHDICLWSWLAIFACWYLKIMFNFLVLTYQLPSDIWLWMKGLVRALV